MNEFEEQVDLATNIYESGKLIIHYGTLTDPKEKKEIDELKRFNRENDTKTNPYQK